MNNGGMKGKFRDRLYRMKILRVKQNKRVDNQQFIQDKVKEIQEVVGKEPVGRRTVSLPKGVIEKDIKQDHEETEVKQVSGDFISVSSSKVVIREEGKKENDLKDTDSKDVVSIQESEKDLKKIKVGIPVQERGVDNTLIRKDSSSQEKVEIDPKEKNQDGKYDYLDKYVRIRKKYVGTNEEEKSEYLHQKSVEIVEKLRTNFEEKLDELEVLESELYLLNSKQDEALELNKVKEIKRRIDELIEKVNSLIEQYNLYNKNYYIDHVVGIDDSVLVDDMIEYRELVDSFEGERKFVKEFKLLDEFQSLYHNLVSVREDTQKIIDQNEDKIEEFDIRDKKYQAICEEMVKVDEVNLNCSHEIERQNEYFTELMGKIDKINHEEYVTYHLRGIGDLIGQSIRYMGLMMLSPLGGFLPGIAASTLATRRLIGNIYQNLHMEEVHRVRYEAINYDQEISHKISDIDYTSVLIEDTLKDIERLKEDFMMQYDSRIPGYGDTLKNIQVIENKIVRNQNRVEIVKKNLKKSQKLNDDKLVKVREMNEHASS